MKSKRRIKPLRCPVCQRERSAQDARRLLGILETDAKKSGRPFISAEKVAWLNRVAVIPSRVVIHWACDICLASGKALPAKPWLQTYGLDIPYYAYADRNFTCDDCGADFVFWAKEQQYWYETRKFIIDSQPKQCPACRRKRRLKKQALLEVSKIFREVIQGGQTIDLKDPAQLAYVAELYLRAGIAGKAWDYYRQAKNKAKGAADSEALQSRLAALKGVLSALGTAGEGVLGHAPPGDESPGYGKGAG